MNENTHITHVASLGNSICVELFDAYGNWNDGFVFWWALEDEDGQRTTVGLDDRKTGPTRHRLYEGARHPKQEECAWIELGSVEEGIVVPLLSNWIDSPETWKPTRTFRPFEEFLEAVQKALLQHGSST